MKRETVTPWGVSILLLVFVLVALLGCKSAGRAAYATLSATLEMEQKAVKSYFVMLDRGQVDPGTEPRVRDLHAKFTESFMAAVSTAIAITGDWEGARSVPTVLQAAADVIDAVELFTAKKVKP
jgi:hypothetical protein